jgi:hypothetical protein
MTGMSGAAYPCHDDVQLHRTGDQLVSTPTHRRRICGATAAIASVALLIAACSSGSSGSQAGSASGESNSSQQKVPLPAGLVDVGQNFGLTTPTALPGEFPLKTAAPKNKHVCFVENGNEYTEKFERGVRAAVKPLGWTLTIIQANQSQASSYGTAITSSLQARCDGVIQPSALYANYEAQIPSAIQAGMIIEDANTANTVGKGVIQVVTANQVQWFEGVATANYVLKDIATRHPTGNILLQDVLVPQYASVMQPIHDGFAHQIARFCDRCTIKTVTDDLSVLTGSNPSAPWVAAVQKNPDTDYLIPAGFTDNGTVAALQQAGLMVPTFVGTGPLAPQIKDMQSSQPASLAWTAEDFEVNGWFMVDGLVRYWANESNLNPWGSLPGMEWVITPANVATFMKQNQTFPQNYAALFESMWKTSES